MNQTLKRRCRFLGLTLALLLLPQPLLAQLDSKDAKPIVVPFELTASKHIIVQVKINGKGPMTLIFDTGAPTMLLSNKAAKVGDVFDKDFKKPTFSIFGAMGQVKIKSLELGAAKVLNTEATVVDHPTVEALAKGEGKAIEGIVGFPFFARFNMTIDYEKKQLTLVPNGYDPPNMIDKLEKILLSGGAKTKKNVLAPGGLLGVKVVKGAADKEAGVTISEVFAGSPAETAGLKAGDRLLVLDGRWTDSVQDTFEAAETLRPGTEVRVTISRGGKEETRTLKVRAGL